MDYWEIAFSDAQIVSEEAIKERVNEQQRAWGRQFKARCVLDRPSLGHRDVATTLIR